MIDLAMTNVRWAEPADDDAVADHIARAVASRPGATIAVPGGRTPLPIFARLAGADWHGITVLPTDDRDVPHDHPASNFGALGNALAATGATLLPLSQGPAPHLDLAWIGMGEDGHVASIFPNLDMNADDAPAVVRTVPDPLPSEAPFARITLNLAALAAAGEIVLVARGARKRQILDDAIAGRSDLPIARLASASHNRFTIFWSAT